MTGQVGCMEGAWCTGKRVPANWFFGNGWACQKNPRLKVQEEREPTEAEGEDSKSQTQQQRWRNNEQSWCNIQSDWAVQRWISYIIGKGRQVWIWRLWSMTTCKKVSTKCSCLSMQANKMTIMMIMRLHLQMQISRESVMALGKLGTRRTIALNKEWQ